MGTAGLRELRQNASELVRRVQAGETVDITVAGRPAARLVPVAPAPWQRWEDVADVLSGPGDPDWEHDRERLDQALTDPWDASQP